MGSRGRCRRPFAGVVATSRLLILLLVAMTGFFCGCRGQQGPSDAFLSSSITYPDRWIGPDGWTYLKVEVPSSFSSLSITVTSDIDIRKDKTEKISKITLPVMCLRGGGLPLPDLSDISLNMAPNFILNGSTEANLNFQREEQCLPIQKNITIQLTNEQISYGVWYIGFFNGLGAARTQSKMISRGHSHTFNVAVKIEECIVPTLWGPQCNQTINFPSCGQPSASTYRRHALDVTWHTAREKQKVIKSAMNNLLENHQSTSDSNLHRGLQTALRKGENLGFSKSFPGERIVTCNKSLNMLCLGNEDINIYSLDVTASISLIKVMASEVKLNDTSLNRNSSDKIILRCYVRYNALPSRVNHDYMIDISENPLVLQTPKIGRLYIAVQAVNQTKINGAIEDNKLVRELCYDFEWKMSECPYGKMGLNCTSEGHILQMITTSSSDLPLEPYYLPMGVDSIDYTDFILEPLLSNYSADNRSDYIWTYFLLDITSGASGSNLHIQLTSDKQINYEMYSRFGGLPSNGDWDYHANSTSSSNNPMFLALDTSNKKSIDFYIVYPKEGTWSFGVKHSPNSSYKFQTFMSISAERCARKCSFHGHCHNSIDESGSTIYSFCSCDRDHGGFDCSYELVSPQGHLWRSIFLIASNGAAILPAIWALRQKAFAEWVIFTSSGISSGLYHACDVGTWCPLSFHVLQFLDFWLSFMAVVSTFIYMTTMKEPSKRAILTGVSILTAILAINGATRAMNIVIVLAIGTLGLLMGWILEFSSSHRSIRFIPGCDLNIQQRLQNFKRWPRIIIDIFRKRFRWYFLLLGFIALSAAGVSWKLETGESYWIWHSLWHITIYTSSFFFLCSTSLNRRSQELRGSEYELSEQNATSRIESTEGQC